MDLVHYPSNKQKQVGLPKVISVKSYDHLFKKYPIISIQSLNFQRPIYSLNIDLGFIKVLINFWTL